MLTSAILTIFAVCVVQFCYSSSLLPPQLKKSVGMGILSCGLISFGIFLGSNQVSLGENIPASYFKENKVLIGEIVKVVDGDTYKFQKASSWIDVISFWKKTDNKLLTVRIIAVDTPEIAKPSRGQAGQKYSSEAKSFAEKKLLNRNIKLKLISKDRYNRILGVVRYSEKSRTTDVDIAEELLREGLAVVYRQGGAQYDGRLKIYNELEDEAIAKRKGIWKDGQDNADLPSNYKSKSRSNRSR